jgi:hypothetical protein
MDEVPTIKEFHLPLEMQFAMRKAELHARELDKEELVQALLNLYHQRLMEWNTLQSLMAEEAVEIQFDIPTDLEVYELVDSYLDNCPDDDEEEDLVG